MAAVTFSAVSKAFGEVQVIHDVDIDIAEGEFVVFVGPSGCGKSTLLRMLAGLETTSAGRIRIGDREVTDLPPKDRDVAMVFQNYALYPHMTVAQNIGFPLRMQRVPLADRQEKVRDAANLLGLENYLQRYPRELSGGQRQRVAMGRAIVRHPSVFLFDEPLSNLDAALRVEMRKEIKGLHRRLGATMIFVTHDQVEAMTMADRIVVLRGGKLEQIGTPQEIYSQPRNTFVAGFIGSPAINLIKGGLGSFGGAPGFMPSSSVGTFIPLEGVGAEASNAATFGVRAEHVVMTSGHQAEGLRGTIAFIESSGPESSITVEIGAEQIVASVWGHNQFTVGQPVSVTFQPRQIHLFDKHGLRVS